MKRLWTIIVVLTVALCEPGIVGSETLTFPSRSSDLPPDSYWIVAEFGEGCCTLDLNTRRWDGNRWNKSTGSAANEQDFDWDLKLYAPANGVIASCWRSFPDDLSPGVNPTNNNVFTGGNHLVIITDQGNAISLNHLKSGTIPAELCPSNADGTEFPSAMTKEGNWRVAAYINPVHRPRVTEGDYLGRVGNSGNSGGPHLHTSISQIVGTDSKGRERLAANSSALKFRHVWGHPFDENRQDTSDKWYRLQGVDFTQSSPHDGGKMLHPSPYLRRASASAGTIRDIDVMFLSSSRAITAIADAANGLKLISWDLVGVDTINRKSEIEAGEIKDVAIGSPAGDHVLVAVRQQDDVLKLIAYHVGPSGNFSRVAEHTAGKISALAMTTTGGPDRKVVTAVRDEAGDLKIIAWNLRFANGTTSIIRLGDASAGDVSALAISSAGNFNGVYTAVRDSENTLKVIPWKLSADGRTVTRGTDGVAGVVGTSVAVAPLAKGVAAAVCDTEGNLRVITWSTDSSGNIGARRGTGIAGDISEVKVLRTPLANSNLTTVARSANGDLILIGWAINDDGTNVRRLGSSRAGAATKIAAHGVMRSYPGKDPRDMILTALRSAEGNLMLITWDTNLNNP